MDERGHPAGADREGPLPEYGREAFARGVQGKYFAAYQAGTNLALLDPDVRAAFPTDETVNEALRLLINVAERTGAKT